MNYRDLYEKSERELKELISAASVFAGTGAIKKTDINHLVGMCYSSAITGRRGKAGLISLYLLAENGLIPKLREALGKPPKIN